MGRVDRSAMPSASVRLEAGRKVLRVGGVIQSVGVDAAHIPDVWDAMITAARPANALILGLGGGTIATLLTQRWGPLPIIGVERDPAVAWLARTEFGLSALPNVEIVIEDAFAYARRSEQCFDLICVDLYVAGKLSHGVLAASFLRDVARLLTPDGLATFNLWRGPALADAARRIARELTILDTLDVEDNVVLRCHRSDSIHS